MYAGSNGNTANNTAVFIIILVMGSNIGNSSNVDNLHYQYYCCHHYYQHHNKH